MDWIRIDESRDEQERKIKLLNESVDDLNRKMALNEAIDQLRRCFMKEMKIVTESEEQALEQAKNQIDSEVKKPDDVQGYINKNDQKVQEKVKDKKLKGAWDLMKKVAGAGKEGLKWIGSHWKIIFVIITAISIWFFAPAIAPWVTGKFTAAIAAASTQLNQILATINNSGVQVDAIKNGVGIAKKGVEAAKTGKDVVQKTQSLISGGEKQTIDAGKQAADNMIQVAQDAAQKQDKTQG